MRRRRSYYLTRSSSRGSTSGCAPPRSTAIIGGRYNYEISVLPAIINDQVRALNERAWQSGLSGTTGPLPGVESALISDRLDVLGLQVAVANLVFRESSLGVVKAYCRERDICYVIVDVLEWCADVSEHSSRWKYDPRAREIWQATDIALPLAWQYDPRARGIVVIRM